MKVLMFGSSKFKVPNLRTLNFGTLNLSTSAL